MPTFWSTEGVYFAAAHTFASTGLVVVSGVLAIKSKFVELILIVIQLNNNNSYVFKF